MNSIVEKPWGYFEVLKTGTNFLLKKIYVNSGGILSLQSHKYRSEHWVVVEGLAEVTLNDKIIQLKENENIFIPKNAVHRLANKCNKKLIIIEIWYGSKLDEEDIKRYEDYYERT